MSLTTLETCVCYKNTNLNTFTYIVNETSDKDLSSIEIFYRNSIDIFEIIFIY